jgi:ParB-like chromosome segregation protein Spo0J
LVDRINSIVAGHGRAGAAKLLGMLKVPTIFRKGVPRI